MKPDELIDKIEALIREYKNTSSTIWNPITGTDIQFALDNAKDGDTINIAPGMYAGNFTVKNRYDQLVVVRATIKGTASFINKDNFQSTLDNLDIPVAGYLFSGINFSNTTPQQTIVNFDTPTEECERISLVDCGIRGDAVYGGKRGLAINGKNMSAIRCNITGFKWQGQDSQAIWIYNGSGPYTIDSCELEASGENLMTGGSTVRIPGIIPSNISITNNIFRKPLSWMDEKWSIKNLLEFKNASDVIISNNIFDGCWAESQVGYAIVITPRSDPYAVTKNINFSNNLIRNIAAGFNILGNDNYAVEYGNQPSGRTENISIVNNLILIDEAKLGGEGRLAMIGVAPNKISIKNNTVIADGSSWIYTYDDPTISRELIEDSEFIGNLAYHNNYGFFGSDSSNFGKATLDRHYKNWKFEQNVLAGGDARNYPIGNFFPLNKDLGESFNPDWSVKDGYNWYKLGCDVSRIPK